MRRKLVSVKGRLRSWNARVGVAHVGAGDETAFQDQFRFHAEERRLPDDEVREFTNLDGTDFMRDALGDGGVDGIFGEVAEGAEIVRRRMGAGFQFAEL